MLRCLELLSFICVSPALPLCCFRNEGCHHGGSSLGNCHTRWFSKQVAFCIKIYQKNIINLPRAELPPPDFVSRPCFGTCQCVASSKTHTPGHREGCAFPRRKRGQQAEEHRFAPGSCCSWRTIWVLPTKRLAGICGGLQSVRGLRSHKTHMKHILVLQEKVRNTWKDPCNQQSRDEVSGKPPRQCTGGCCCARRPLLHPAAQGELCRAGKICHITVG